MEREKEGEGRPADHSKLWFEGLTKTWYYELKSVTVAGGCVEELKRKDWLSWVLEYVICPDSALINLFCSEKDKEETRKCLWRAQGTAQKQVFLKQNLSFRPHHRTEVPLLLHMKKLRLKGELTHSRWHGWMWQKPNWNSHPIHHTTPEGNQV